MKKILKIFSIIVIVLFFLSLFGWMVHHITKGDKQYGFLTKPIKYIISFPDLFSRSVKEVKSLPGTFVRTPDNFEAINLLDEDLIVLTTYSDTNKTRVAELVNLINNKVLYRWNIKNPYQEHDRIMDPLLLPQKSLCLSFNGASGLFKIDSLSNRVWQQDSIRHHHSLNMDINGDIWACSYEPVYHQNAYYKLNGGKIYYHDNFITKIDSKSGNIIFHKSFTDILKENNLEYWLLKSANVTDPIHINDIQPALKTTQYYKKGDLFISSRNLSFIMQYRPENNEVIKIIDGPFSCQHDVDFLNDSVLVFFNNNAYYSSAVSPVTNLRDSLRTTFAGDFYSNITRYNFNTGRISFIGDSVFRENKIFTFTEGIVEFIDPETYYVEEQNDGILWVIKNDKIIYKNVLKSKFNGYHHLPNWNRIIK